METYRVFFWMAEDVSGWRIKVVYANGTYVTKTNPATAEFFSEVHEHAALCMELDKSVCFIRSLSLLDTVEVNDG